MKTSLKAKKARKHIEAGKLISQRIAWFNWEFASLRIWLGRERKKLRKQGKDIINLHADMGIYGLYYHSDFKEKYKDYLKKK